MAQAWHSARVPHELPRFAELVLDVVVLVPAGKVMTYGDVADYLGQGGPRQVGAVLARYGSGVPWWRVLRADGTPPSALAARAFAAYAREGTPLRPGGERVDLRLARWAGAELASPVRRDRIVGEP